MHTVWSRANALLFFTLTAMAVVAVLCDISTVLMEQKIAKTHIPDLKVKSLRYNKGRYQSFDEAKVHLNLHADFSELFSWNVKQLFVYIQAAYTSKDGVDNRLVLWDAIVPRSGEHKIDLVDQTPEYKLYDVLSSLSEATLNISVNWDVMPQVGRLQLYRGHSQTFKLPKVQNTK